MLNEVRLIGNVGSDPEIRQVNETKVARISLATSESYKDKNGQKQTVTEWHTVNLWGALADICEKYVKKGDRIFVGGSIHYRTWEKDGQKHYSTEIKADSLKMLGGVSNESKPEPKADAVKEDGMDSLPF